MTMWNAAQPSPAPDHNAGHAETVELQSLLQTVYENYGYDFRNYADGPLRRRVWRCIHDEALESVGALERRLATDRGCLTRLLARLSVHVTSMFRDPAAFLAF